MTTGIEKLFKGESNPPKKTNTSYSLLSVEASKNFKIIGEHTIEYWRMHYAGLAMQANINLQVINDFSNLAKESFMIADAMIKQAEENQ